MGLCAPLLASFSHCWRNVVMSMSRFYFNSCFYILHSRLFSCLIATAFQPKVKRECTHALLSSPLSKPSEVCTEQEGRENWNCTFLQDHGLETFKYRLDSTPLPPQGLNQQPPRGLVNPFTSYWLSLVVSTDSRTVSSQDCARPSVKRTQFGFCPGLSQ